METYEYNNISLPLFPLSHVALSILNPTSPHPHARVASLARSRLSLPWAEYAVLEGEDEFDGLTACKAGDIVGMSAVREMMDVLEGLPQLTGLTVAFLA